MLLLIVRARLGVLLGLELAREAGVFVLGVGVSGG